MTATTTSTRKVLIDTSEPLRLQTNESSDGDKRLYAEGKIGHCGVPTLNGRLYTIPIMRREVNRLQPRIEQASLYAAVDHPGDGKSRIMNSGAIIRGLRVEDDGTIWGKFEIVEETDCGRNLAALLRRGGAVGVSSRGLGSTTTNEHGHDVVGEDYRLVSFDFVLDPAVNTAYPQVFSEDLEVEKVSVGALKAKFPKLIKQIEESAQELATETIYEAVRSDIESDVEKALSESKIQLREQFKAELYPEVVKELKEDFGVKLIRSLAEMRKEVESVVRSELAADPAVAGAKLALEQVAKIVTPFRPTPDVKRVIDEKDQVVEELKKSISSLEKELNRVRLESQESAGKARTLGYQLFVERSLAGRTDADTIRGMIGSVESVGSAAELKQKVEAAIAAADKALAEAKIRAQAELQVTEQVSTKKAELESKRAKKAAEREELLREKVAALSEQFERVAAEKNAELNDAKRRINMLEQRLDQAARIAEQLEIQNFAQTRLAGHPKRVDILREIQRGTLRSKAEINKLAEDTEMSFGDDGAQERVRRIFGRGREHMPEEARRRHEQLTESFTPVPGLEGFDISIEEIRKLSRAGERGR